MKIKNLASKLLSNNQTTLIMMKKHFRRDHSDETTRHPAETSAGSVGRWSFNLASESLFMLGATERTRRLAYRTATGELRFLPK